MRKDYHMHPTVIQTPERFDRFVQQARKMGIAEICITDHMPLSISAAKDRIPHGMVTEYCKKVRELACKYEGILSIKCGIEVDFHPDYIDEIERVLSAGDFDYTLASSHMHVFLKDFSKYTHNDFAHLALENTLAAVESGRFSAIAHLDMFKWVFTQPNRFPLIDDGYLIENHTTLLHQVLNAIKNKGMYLEINPHFAESKGSLEYVYPDKSIVSMALEKGIRFSYGSDAHKPESVGVLLNKLEKHPLYSKALAMWEG